MTLARWSPASELTSLHSAMDRLFDEFLTGRTGEGGAQAWLRTFLLPIDVEERPDRYVIHAPVPGFRPDEVELTAEDGVLTIQARHAEEKAPPQPNLVRREILSGNFVRRVQLASDARVDDIKAHFENGMLRLEVPRAQRPKPMKIPIAHAGEKKPAGTQRG
ncbi:MAG TPA: Hsp20/alpha crystallin family protein [Candidatus Dormibacteraeota bacterium]|nr:Hsp20/alpha crystallin family protein [Candidatus Dormibacteraeota bacterium]